LPQRLSSFYEIVENLLETFFRGSFFDVHFNVGGLWASLRLWRLSNVYSHTPEMPEKMRQDLLFDVETGDRLFEWLAEG
jgi:hypothetical protein